MAEDMKQKIKERIKMLEEENGGRLKNIQMHGHIKEQLINQHVESQGAIAELKDLLGIKEEMSQSSTPFIPRGDKK